MQFKTLIKVKENKKNLQEPSVDMESKESLL